MHNFMIPDDLDTDFLTPSCNVSCTDNVWEDTLACVAEHVVSTVQDFASLNAIIAIGKNKFKIENGQIKLNP